jgi:DNA-binding transcriptional LysR family regulator
VSRSAPFPGDHPGYLAVNALEGSDSMKIRYLRDFLVLAETGNFQTAAEELFFSQPSLTRHIKLLEEDLGVPVFDRTTRKIELNQYGRLLLPYAKEITRLYDELAGSISSRQRSASNLVTIGSVPSMTQYNIPNILEWFKSRNPFTPIRIIEEGSSKLVQLLEEEQCDFAFVRAFRSDAENPGDERVTLPLTSEVMVALISPAHPLAKEKSLAISQFENESLILPKGELLYKKLVSAFIRAGFQPNIAYIGSRPDDAADMVRKGIGIAFMGKASTHSFSKDGITIHELDSDFIMDISLTYLKSRKMNPPCTSFLETVMTWISERSKIVDAAAF